jgi:hypothetical protein
MDVKWNIDHLMFLTASWVLRFTNDQTTYIVATVSSMKNNLELHGLHFYFQTKISKLLISLTLSYSITIC